MGFYGNSFYQLTNAFGKFIVKNAGKNKTDFITPGSESVENTAIGLGATYAFDTGNKWISLQGNSADGVCTIFHAPLDESDKNNSMATIEKASANASATQLVAGDYLEVPKLSWDNAGHITGTDGSNWYRLPVSQTETDIQDLKDRMSDIESNDTTQNTTLTTLDDRVESLEVLPDLVGRRTSFTSFNSEKTITQALGNVETMENQYQGGATEVDSFSDAVLDLDARATELESQLAFIGDRTALSTDATMTLVSAIGNMDKITEAAYTDLVSAIITLTNSVNTINSSITFITGALGTMQEDIDKLKSYHTDEV